MVRVYTFFYLLAQMRTAIFLLVMTALASVAGTLVQQDLDPERYQAVYGTFWYGVFDLFGLFDIFRAPWLWALFLFLMISVASCLTQRFKGMGRQLGEGFLSQPRSFKPQGSSFIAATFPFLKGWREVAHTQKNMCFYTRGSWNRLGYFLLHGGVLLLALGGFITGVFGYRATLNIREGETDRYAMLFKQGGMQPQALPFLVRHEAFSLEHYDNGMPKQYRTTLVLEESGKRIVGDVSVNHPFSYKGYTFYQSSFGDGGSAINLTVQKIGEKNVKPYQAEVYDELLLEDDVVLTLEDFRPHTVTPVPQIQRFKEPIFQDLGPSLDYTLSGPSFKKQRFRVYQNHPNMLGIQAGESAEGEVEFLPLSLGFDVLDGRAWQKIPFLLQAFKEGRAAGLKLHLQDVLEVYPSQEQGQRGIALLQALPFLEDVEVPYGLHFSDFTLVRYSGLQVVYDPGTWLFWLGSGLLMLGVLLMTSFTHARLWVEVLPKNKGYRVTAQSHRGKDYEQQIIQTLRG